MVNVERQKGTQYEKTIFSDSMPLNWSYRGDSDAGIDLPKDIAHNVDLCWMGHYTLHGNPIMEVTLGTKGLWG